MITAYYTDTKKYLQKDNYIKHFDVNSLDELVKHIKIDDDILIKANSADILKFKLKNKNKNISYQIIHDVEPLTKDTVNNDLTLLEQGLKSYIIYKPKNTALYGERVYLTKDMATCSHLNKTGKYLAVCISQLKDMVSNPQKIMLQNTFLGKVI